MENSQVVPKEPTEEMRKAFWHVWHELQNDRIGTAEVFRLGYVAMLAAAPKADK